VCSSDLVLIDKKEIKLKRAKKRILNECPYSTVHTFLCDISKEKNLIKLKKKIKTKKNFYRYFN
jgi:short-subunit dehydrogenase